MRTGIVVKFARDYGFIKPDAGGDDVFVHFSDIMAHEGDWKELMPKQRVKFSIREKNGRPCAVNVEVIQ